MKKAPKHNKSARRYWIVFGGLVFLLAILISVIASPFFLYDPKSDIAFLQEASRQAFQLMRFDVSRDVSKSALELSPDSFDLNMIHATSQLELGNRTEAKTYFKRASKNSGKLTADGFCDTMLEIASGLRSRGRLYLSELALEVAYETAPNRLDAGEKYALLKAQIGSRWEARKIFADMLTRNVFSLDCLVFLANEEIEIDFEKQMKEYWTKAPEDPLANLGVGYYQYLRGEVDSAIRSVQTCIASAPERVDAHALLGQCLLVQDPSRLSEWESKLPNDADSSPAIWFVRAMALKGNSDFEQTQLALSRALQLMPYHTPSLLELTRILNLLGKKDFAESISGLTRTIQSAHKDAKWLNEVREDSDRMGQIAQHLDALSRTSEIRAWSSLAHRINPNTQAFAWLQHANRKQATIALFDLSKIGALSDKPYKGLAASSDPTTSTNPSIARPEEPDSAIPEFIDKALSAGVDFRYFSGRNEPISGRRMHEFGGGGVGILDYDRDGWPDFFLAQGCRLSASGESLPETENPYLDKLYRNVTIQNEEPRFAETTELAGIRELEFGQGVSIGDLNGDGFDDIYVCNVGPNTLWINQGDGTFQDKTDWIPRQKEWTVSAAIADLDRDGFADIFDVNYVKGENVYELLCDNDGKMTACGPNTFTPTPDRFLQSSQEGLFLDRSKELANVDPGNGLGIVAFRFPNSPSINLYIANDATPNVLVETPERTNFDSPLFEDSAILKGVAFDGGGMAEGSMGIAVGDANRDGLLDFFVTNVFHESFTLYLQNESGSFDDRTGAFRLTKPTYDLLGFGTQFIDVDRDGFEDLIGVNGDVDDLSHSGRPFRMPPFLFVNNKGKSFASTVPEKSENFFKIPQVGRALATADLNRDGSMDFVATCLDGNTAVVFSKPADDNFFLIVEVVGTVSERTAIGTSVTVQTDDGKIMRQLTAGGGYMSTNERILHFGLGKAKIQSVTVEWPSGIHETLREISPNSRLKLIEPSTR